MGARPPAGSRASAVGDEPGSATKGGAMAHGASLRGLLEASESLFAETGCFQGVVEPRTKRADPIRYERFHSRLLAILISVRDTMKFIASSPGVRETDEYVVALYTPEGDSIALSTGIMVHVHTLSEFIKYMIRNGYEDDPGIKDGDIFANNESWAGGAHTPDVQMAIPIFVGEELVGWVGSVTHELEVGTWEGGGLVVFAPERYGEGLHISAERIGEGDRISRSYIQRVTMGVRNPDWWILDEKSKLAGCIMVREAVRQVVAEFGLDYYRSATTEIIEEGRQNFLRRVRRTLVPGTYRSHVYFPILSSHVRYQHPLGSRDSAVLIPIEMRVQPDARLHVSLEGCSPWGFHPYNATPSAVLGGLFITLVQTLNHDGKVNDGAYHAVKMELPAGSIINGTVPNLATSLSWRSVVPVFSEVLRLLSLGCFARGFLEEVMLGTNNSLMNGAGYDAYGRLVGLSNFELAAGSSGAKAVADGIDCGHALWNPEGLQGDVEVWEMAIPELYLGRNFCPDRHGFGRYRGGQAWSSLWLVHGTSLFYSTMFASNAGGVPYGKGMFGGYPAPGWRCMFATRTNLPDLIAAGRDLPNDLDSAKAMLERGELTADLVHFSIKPTWTENMADGDLFGIEYVGGAGYGDPLHRDPAAVAADLENGLVTAECAERVYGVVLDRLGQVDESATTKVRDASRRARLHQYRSVKEWWLDERRRVAAGAVHPLVADMYRAAGATSAHLRQEMQRGWCLPTFPFADPVTAGPPEEPSAGGDATVPVTAATTTQHSGDGSVPVERAERFGAVSHAEPDTEEPEDVVEDLMGGHLSAERLRTLQNAPKSEARFRSYLAVLQRQLGWSERILLPLHEHLMIVASGDDALVKARCGLVLGDYRVNWKLGALVRVRDDDQSLSEVYGPEHGLDPELCELRELVCPGCGVLLEVDTAPPGYPLTFEFLPDLNALWSGWLGEELDLPQAADRSQEVMASWLEEIEHG